MAWVLASDIDGTLTGDPPALASLNDALQAQRQAGGLFLILSTGRRLDQVLAGHRDEGLPACDAIISQVGTEIYLPPFAADAAPMTAWDSILHSEYYRQEAVAFLEDVPGLRLQPDYYNSPLKVSAYLDGCPDPEAAAATIVERAERHGGGRYRVVWSSGRDLDILPNSSGKGKAVRFLVDHQRLDIGRTVVAGDTGNDRTMFEEIRCGVVVANAQPELVAVLDAVPTGRFVQARSSYAAGVHEGLRELGFLPA